MGNAMATMKSKIQLPISEGRYWIHCYANIEAPLVLYHHEEFMSLHGSGRSFQNTTDLAGNQAKQAKHRLQQLNWT